MQTPKPTISTSCVSKDYPSLRGNCEIGVIDVYDEKYMLLKSVTVSKTNYYINIPELTFKALLIKNTGIGMTTSVFSNIVVKCCDCNLNCN